MVSKMAWEIIQSFIKALKSLKNCNAISLSCHEHVCLIREKYPMMGEVSLET